MEDKAIQSKGLSTKLGDIVGQQAQSHAPIGGNHLVPLDDATTWNVI